MAVIVNTEPVATVRKIKIEIGKEWVAIDFGREIPREEAMKRARQTLESLA